jgi:hypothetical protein
MPGSSRLHGLSRRDGVLFFNGPRHSEQFGTEFQAGIRGCLEANVETDTAIVDYKGDDPSLAKEVGAVSNREYRWVGGTKGCRDTAIVANEKHLARFRLIRSYSFDGDSVPVDELAFDELINRPAKWIVAKDTDGERSIRGSESAWRPLHKLSEVQEKSGFDVVFERGRWRGIKNGPVTNCGQQEQENTTP